MSKNNRDDEQLQTIATSKKVKRKVKIHASFQKAVQANGEALDKLSRN